MSLSAFTQLHVALSLIGILAGIVVVSGMLNGKDFRPWRHCLLCGASGRCPRRHRLP